MSLLDLLPPPWVLFLLITAAVWYYWQQQGVSTAPQKNIAPRKDKKIKKRLIVRRDAETREKVIRMVMIGKTGTGKSATANSIFGCQDAFKSQRAWQSATQSCRKRAVVINDTEIQIIDTPGVLDTDRKQEDVEREIMKCICLSSPGPHVFIMTIRSDLRFTAEEYTAYEMLKKMFGKKVVDYMVVVFTIGDQLDGKTVEQMLDAAPSNLKTVMKEIQYRYVVFNNKAKDDEVKDAQLLKLLEITNDMISCRVEKYFTNEQTQKAEDRIEKKVLEVMRREGIGAREARDLLMRDIEHDQENSFLSNVASSIGMTALIAGAVGLAWVTGGASLAALGLVAEGSAATGAVVTAVTSALSSAALAEAASKVGKKMCSIM